MWILILCTLAITESGLPVCYSGGTVTTVEFHTQSACEQALDFTRNKLLTGVCVPKKL